MTQYTAFFPFCGLGAGALGFLDAQISMFGDKHSFRAIGGIDNDAAACADFEMLVGAPALCADIHTLTAAQLIAFAGVDAPDVIFSSPPCKGFSALLSKDIAKGEKYQQMNQLVLDWLKVCMEAWGKCPPRLILMENVPRITSRGKGLIAQVKSLLGAHGYVFHSQTHDCGELGGLAQRRKRFLLVARHQDRCPPLLYQPPRKRVRGCGEVLEKLPMPNDPTGGPMHEMPRISWMNWLRLALIPAGGDWRDLPGVLETGQARREVFRRHHVGDWKHPAETVAGAGSNGVNNIADPRVVPQTKQRQWFNNVYKVVPWDEPSGTIIGAAKPSSGAASVSDPRVKFAYDHGYAVLTWQEPSATIAAGSHPGQGAYSVADPRLDCVPRSGAYGVLSWEDAAKVVTGSARVDNGAFAIADPRTGDIIERVELGKAPTITPVIVAADGTWHRPLTTLELAALQGLPTAINGVPLKLTGTSSSAWRERIGNAVPPPAARAIAEQMLVCLVCGSHQTMTLSTNAVWVREQARANLALYAPWAVTQNRRQALLQPHHEAIGWRVLAPRNRRDLKPVQPTQ